MKSAKFNDAAVFVALAVFVLLSFAWTLWVGAEEPKVSIEINAKPGVTRVTTYPALRTTVVTGATEAIVRNYPAMGITTIDVAPKPLLPLPPPEPRVEATKDSEDRGAAQAPTRTDKPGQEN